MTPDVAQNPAGYYPARYPSAVTSPGRNMQKAAEYNNTTDSWAVRLGFATANRKISFCRLAISALTGNTMTTAISDTFMQPLGGL
jgi:hypothetical protein